MFLSSRLCLVLSLEMDHSEFSERASTRGSAWGLLLRVIFVAAAAPAPPWTHTLLDCSGSNATGTVNATLQLDARQRDMYEHASMQASKRTKQTNMQAVCLVLLLQKQASKHEQASESKQARSSNNN